VITVGYHCYQLHTEHYQVSSVHIDEIIGDHQGGSQCNMLITDQFFLLSFFFLSFPPPLLSSDTVEKWEIIHHLFIDSEKSYDSVRREVLYNILIDFGVSIKLIRLIEMCLNETYSEVCICTHLCDTFSIQNKEILYCHYFLILL
jgi:hypothetical protein